MTKEISVLIQVPLKRLETRNAIISAIKYPKEKPSAIETFSLLRLTTVKISFSLVESLTVSATWRSCKHIRTITAWPQNQSARK